VRLGEHDTSTVTDCNAEGVCLDPVQDIDIEKMIKHEKYDRVKKINDIALLRLATAADTTKDNVRTICLPIDSESSLEKLAENVKRNMTIAGWGKIGNRVNQRSDVLMKASVGFIPLAECSQKFAEDKIPVYVTYLCAGQLNQKIDTCQGELWLQSLC